MASVYSVQLYEGRNVNDGSLTVPDGFIWIVRDIDAFFGGGLDGGACNFIGSLGQTFAYFSFTGLVSSSFSWRGRQVFNPGQTFGFISDRAGVDVTISGYQLTLP